MSALTPKASNPMSDPVYRICKRCVMDVTDPQIIFDADGHCNHCREFIDKRSRYKYSGQASDEALASVVETMKKAGKDSDYDCVLGLSGGIDSSYAAYIARGLGLRVLAVHLDNGWNSEEAVLNIKNVCKKLDIDYESYVLDWDEFREIQLAFLRASVPEAETPTDMAIPAAWHRTADKLNVKYIVSGGNFATEGILPGAWHYNAKDTRYFNHILRTFGGRIKRTRTFPVFGYAQEAYYKLARRIRVVYLLNYVPYAKADAMQLLEEKLDWRFYGGKHYESKFTGWVQSHYLYKKFGIDYRRATAASQVCTGEITRDEALAILENKPYDDERVVIEMAYIAKKLGLSEDELRKIVEASPRYYWDYPNDEGKLRIIYSTYRRLFGKEKLHSF